MKRFVPTVLAVAVAGILLTRTVFTARIPDTGAPGAHAAARMFPGRLPAAARVAANGGDAQRIRSPEARRNCWLAHDRKKRGILSDPARPR